MDPRRLLTFRAVVRAGSISAGAVLAEDFYAERLARHGIEALVPAAPTRARLDEIIFGELTVGEVRPESQADLRAAVEALAEDGAEAVALACTELELAITTAQLPLIATARTHALAAAERALAE